MENLINTQSGIFQIAVGSLVTLIALLGATQLLITGKGRQRLLEQRKKMQTYEVGKARNGEGAPRRRVGVTDLIETYDSKIRTLYDLFNATVDKLPKKQLFGNEKKTR
jgi:hypothetical protein